MVIELPGETDKKKEKIHFLSGTVLSAWPLSITSSHTINKKLIQ
jgi:hypothetical protein